MGNSDRPATVASFDGTPLLVHTCGAPDGPRVLLVGPPIASPQALSDLVGHLAYRFWLTTWGLRGLYGSGRTERAGTVADHARDGLEIAARSGGPVLLVGWSSGAEVAAAMAQSAPSGVCGVAFISPLWGRATAGALELSLRARLAGRLLASRAGLALAERAGRAKSGAKLMKSLRLASGALDDAALQRLVRDADSSQVAMTAVAAALAQGGAALRPSAFLHPTLVLTGELDPASPSVTARRLARLLPAGQLHLVRGGTHFTLLEYPDLVALRLEAFFDSLPLANRMAAAILP